MEWVLSNDHRVDGETRSSPLAFRRRRVGERPAVAEESRQRRIERGADGDADKVGGFLLDRELVVDRIRELRQRDGNGRPVFLRRPIAACSRTSRSWVKPNRCRTTLSTWRYAARCVLAARS